MGCSGSKEDNQKSEDIDRFLWEEKKRFDTEIKVLLLGAGESGKSTVAKQLKIIHMNGFTVAELGGYKLSILNNVLICMRALVQAARNFEYDIENEDAAERVLLPENENVRGVLDRELAEDCKELWKDKAIKKAYERQNEFQLYDCAAYIFDNLDRIAEESYIPTVEDVLLTRVKTTGISEIEFSVDNTRFKVVDVGGQRNERKKWMNCFDNVNAVLFVVALSEYNLKLYEDGTTNRMQESLKLFKDTCNSTYFVDTPVIVFLNKCDLFAEKIEKFPLEDYFADYTGGADFDRAVTFISQRFEAQNMNPNKPMYFHVTCATDTESITAVFGAVQDALIRNAMAGMQGV